MSIPARTAAVVTSVLLALAGCHGGAVGTVFGARGDVLVIEGATLVDGRLGSQRDVTILAEDGRIIHVGPWPEALPEGAQILDGAGRFVIPGLIDVHAHDASRAYLARMLAWGVTSVQVMPKSPPWSPVEAERVSQSPEAPMPRLQLTPMFAIIQDDSTPGPVRSTARIPSLGADALLHGTMDATLTDEALRLMQEAGGAWTPTLHALHLFGDQRRYARRLLAVPRFTAAAGEEELARRRALADAEAPVVPPGMDTLVEHTSEYVTTIARNTRRALRHGIPVAVGSDGGPAGVSTQIELALLQAKGMTPAEVLTAATHGGAVAMGWEEEVGFVAVGKLADLVVLDADPRTDVRHCRRIVWVIKGGRPYRPESLLAASEREDPRGS